MPMKPHKWGFKFFILCGVSGFAYDFELYSGQENDSEKRPTTEPDLGASSIYSLGTVRRNRIPNCKLPTEIEMKKEIRGPSFEYMENIEGVDITSLVWKDNKTSHIERYDRKTIACPMLVKQYNKHMGGVDLLDSNIGRYHNTTRSKKWYIRVIQHLIDMAVVNSWLLYRRIQSEKAKSDDNSVFYLSKFRQEVATTMCQIKKEGAYVFRTVYRYSHGSNWTFPRVGE
ncbi:uncharacterized protein LOC135931467 [Gordionus sp. m RMFG-2023]|uniref:uncharacterized protein LOC135931467 n=1 Tax=Gordionus sp. m RMFG-2023 TaxID=3053472 RepID=UPI0031FC0A59